MAFGLGYFGSRIITAFGQCRFRITWILVNQTLSISKTDPDNIIRLDSNSISVAQGATATFVITLLAPTEPGLYTATVYVGGEQILISINSKSKLLLFDSNIVVLNKVEFNMLKGKDDQNGDTREEN